VDNLKKNVYKTMFKFSFSCPKSNKNTGKKKIIIHAQKLCFLVNFPFLNVLKMWFKLRYKTCMCIVPKQMRF